MMQMKNGKVSENMVPLALRYLAKRGDPALKKKSVFLPYYCFSIHSQTINCLDKNKSYNCLVINEKSHVFPVKCMESRFLTYWQF